MSLPLFLVPILAGLTAQALKPLFNRHWYSTLNIAGRTIPRYGGMPSAHTSFAVSLATTVGLADGFSSSSFAITAALFILILDDALRMRIFLGRYGQALRKLISQLPEEKQQDFPFLEGRLGHKPLEVVAGAVVGLGVTLLIMLLLPV